MELMIPSIVSLLCILIIIGGIIFAFVKKIMMTYVLIIVDFIIFVVSFLNPIVIYELGFRPEYLSIDQFPQVYTIITSMFLHSTVSPLHIIGNVIVFLFMGIAFEQRIGMKNLLVIYLLTGVCGALAHTVLNLGSTTILIGASGAIFGILGAFAYSYPRDEVVMPIPLLFIMIFRRIKVIYAAILFAVLETVIVLYGYQDNTAHFAHLGGLLSGVILASALIGRQGEKISQTPIATVSYGQSPVQQKKQIDYFNLKKLATTQELKELLDRIENETVLQVRDIWLDHFLEKTVCPKCGKSLNHYNRKIWCEDKHFFTEY